MRLNTNYIIACLGETELIEKWIGFVGSYFHPSGSAAEMNNKTEYVLVGCLISTAILIDTAGAQPKISAANRETVRIMRTIKIPPPYTPVYQPYVRQQYLPPAGATPDYSPKIMPAQPFSVPKSTAVEPSALPVATTNATSTTVTNVTTVDKTVKTPTSVATPGKGASEFPKPVEKEKSTSIQSNETTTR